MDGMGWDEDEMGDENHTKSLEKEKKKGPQSPPKNIYTLVICFSIFVLFFMCNFHKK